MPAIKTFYFRVRKATLQKLTPPPGIGKRSNFKIVNGNLYFLFQIMILH